MTIQSFQRGENYIIHYPTFSKLATFLHRNETEGTNCFRDRDGEFEFSDSFLAKGTVKVEHLPDVEPDDENILF